MKFIFMKLFYLSINIAENYTDVKSKIGEVLNKNISQKNKNSNNSSLLNHSNTAKILAANKIKVKDIQKMIVQEEDYLENFYDDCFVNLIFPYGQSRLQLDKF